MEPVCISHVKLPHTSKLFADFLYRFDRVSEFYSADFRDPESYVKAAGSLDYPDSRRTALVAALRKQNADGPQLDMLARPGTVAVVAGQQTGLFSGPCYTIYKALTAAKLARHLTSRGIPAVAVFWLATEDHDAAEVNHCWTFDHSHESFLLRIDTAEFPAMPVGRIPLGNVPLAELRASLGAFPFSEEVAALAEASYAPGRTLADAFRDMLGQLLFSCGLVFLDPIEPAIRELVAPVLRDAVERTPDLVHQLSERDRALKVSGYHSQVRVGPSSSLFFLLDGDRRVVLRRRDGGYSAGGRPVATGQLAAQAASLSPGALLRPVVQDFLLPTVAYIGGPAEVAYFAQASVLYRDLLGRMPVVVPRSAFTVLDARAAGLMERYGLALESCFHGIEGLKDEIARKLVPAELDASLRRTTGSVTDEIAGFRGQIAAFDSTLAAALDKSRSKILYQLSKIGRKVARESMRRDRRALAEADYLYNLVYPNKHLQERFYTILPFLARHGLDFIDRLYENARLDCPDHVVIAA